MLDYKEVYYPDNLEEDEEGYTFERVLNEVCKGNVTLAKNIWSCQNGAFPETMIEEWKTEGEVVEYNHKFYFIHNNEEYDMLRSIGNFLDEDYKQAIMIANNFREEQSLPYTPFNDPEKPDWVLVYKKIQEIFKHFDSEQSIFKRTYSVAKIDKAYSIQKCFGFEHEWVSLLSCDDYIIKLNKVYNAYCFGEFEGLPIMLKDIKPCLLLSNDGEGYCEYLLAANKISQNNGFHLVVNKNGEPEIGGAMIIQDTPTVRKILDAIPESEQYETMIQLRHPQYAKLYWND